MTKLAPAFPAALLVTTLASALVAMTTLGCERPGTTEALLELDGFADPRVGELRNVKAEIVVTNANGEHVDGKVDVEGNVYDATSPFPLSCDGDTCQISVRLRPGEYDFSMQLFAEDHCGTSAKLLELRPASAVTVAAGIANTIEFTRESFAFDDDEDGIENAFEILTCGRFDAADNDQRWRNCKNVDDPCCVNAGDPRIGKSVYFGGLAFPSADGLEVNVDNLYLDATEVTWGTLRRCVAARVCLVDNPNHQAWDFVVDTETPDDEPVVGLVPSEAQQLCEWLGKTLPTTAQRDRVVAGRDDGTRASFPWDGDPDVGCLETDSESVVANHRALGRACHREAIAVGQFPSSDVVGTLGNIGVADLAGNVAEWTVDLDLNGAYAFLSEVPPGTSLVKQSGGGFDSIPLFLENDVSAEFPIPQESEIELVAQRRDALRRLAAVTGFRCVTTIAPPSDVATCPSLEDD